MAESPKVLKDAELQRYYDRLFAMHGSPGWSELMEDVRLMEEAHDTLDSVHDAETLWKQQGRLEIIRWLQGHAEMVEKAYIHVLENETDEEAPAATGGVAKVVNPNEERHD